MLVHAFSELHRNHGQRIPKDGSRGVVYPEEELELRRRYIVSGCRFGADDRTTYILRRQPTHRLTKRYQRVSAKLFESEGQTESSVDRVASTIADFFSCSWIYDVISVNDGLLESLEIGCKFT
jgi:hypothetical protein